MKTKQTKMNRSGAKWLPGAMALAATTSTQAAVVQITLTGNQNSANGGNTLNADLTGDLVNDVQFFPFGGPNNAFAAVLGGGLNGTVGASFQGPYSMCDAYIGGAGVGSVLKFGFPGQVVTHMNPFNFQDSRINGGVQTGAWLEVKAFSAAGNETVAFTRLIFNDANTTRPAFASVPGAQTEWSAVPEPSSFALLALGAGGLIARRRRAA